jgi:hypothetical protein
VKHTRLSTGQAKHLYHSCVYSYKGYNRSLKKTRFQKCFEKNLRKSQWHYWFNKVILLKRSDSDRNTKWFCSYRSGSISSSLACCMFVLNLNLVFFFSVILWVITCDFSCSCVKPYSSLKAKTILWWENIHLIIIHV